LIALGLVFAGGRAQDLKLELQIDQNRQEFHVGEPIHIQLGFTASVPQTYGVEGRMPQRRYDAGLEEVVISPTDGWIDPWADYRKKTTGAFVGGGLNSYGLLSSKPFEITLRLDEYARFLKPGCYTVEVISSRASRADVGPTPEPVRLVSNSVSFTILPTIPDWQEEGLHPVLAVLNGAGTPPNEAYEWLQTLDTTAAAAAMISLTASDTRPGADYFLANGLLLSSHRQYIIDSMKQKVSEPGFAVRSYFVDTLAELMVLQAGACREFLNCKSEIARQLQKQVLAALPRKQASAKAATLSALIDCIVGPCPEHAQGGAAQLLTMAAGIFPELTGPAQYTVLSSQWDSLRGPAMMPVLRAYLQGPKPREWDELALHRFAELAPADARTIILGDARRAHPRFLPRALGILPGTQLPELDGVLASNLDDPVGSDTERVAALIERYASPAILPEVEAFYQSVPVGRWACAIEDSLLAYMLKVDADGSTDRVSEALAARGSTGCYRYLLFDLAQQQPTAELQALAVAALDDPDPEVAISAANTLALVGDASAKEALFERFQRWHETWAGREDELNPRPGRDIFANDAPLGDAILRALVGANNWLLSDAEVERASDLLLGAQEREQASYLLAAFRARPVPISADEDPVYPQFDVGGYTGRSLELLKHKVDRYPAGTVFQFQGTTSTYHVALKELSTYLAESGKRMVFAKSAAQ
jgi:hypothetical protein